jgi:hypothetical protein
MSTVDKLHHALRASKPAGDRIRRRNVTVTRHRPIADLNGKSLIVVWLPVESSLAMVAFMIGLRP